ncbi:MAG: relaxase, partial [Pseudomonadota bacterium]
MILHGNQRGGGRDLSLHLMKDENDHIHVHEIRGFIAQDLVGAFKESYAISKATRCRQHLFSLSINPPNDADISTDAFIDAIEQVEKKLNLDGQPRAIVFHEKKGMDGETRRHAHAVWCRIDTGQMKAVQLSHSKLKLRDVSRDLHIQHDLKMPPGLINSKDRDPRNFTLEQWQQCKRAKVNIHQIRDAIKDAWAISDSRSSFAHALAERGYILAKVRRGHVAVDHKGETFAVSRYVGIKAAHVRAKLGEADGLASIEAAQKQAAKQITDRLVQLKDQEATKAMRVQDVAIKRDKSMQAKQSRETSVLRDTQQKRAAAEEQARQARIRKGVMGFVDRLTGRRKRTLQENTADSAAKQLRNQHERRALQHKQAHDLQSHRNAANTARSNHMAAACELGRDIEAFRNAPEVKKDLEKAAYVMREQKRTRKPRR